MARNNVKTKKLTIYAMIVAIELLLGLTVLGYIKIGVVELTIMQLPVIIGGVLLGPWAGAFFGGVFGLTSFYQCFGMSAFGATLLGINPFYTFILCFFPRLIMGFLVGLISQQMSRNITAKKFAPFVASLSGALLNTILFCVTLILLFWNTEYIQSLASGLPVFPFLAAFVGVNGLIEAAVCFVIGSAVCKALYVFKEKIGLGGVIK
ncbi:MAG: ECF transporter S component [Clostridiales bacterium]|nr:MAG: ECF transporter S component [Clostridiales bacterium]